MGQLTVGNEMQAMTLPKMMEQASLLVKSGLMPKELNTPEKVVSVAIFGKANGLTFEEATVGGDVYVFEAKGGKLCMMVRSERKLDEMMCKIPGFFYEDVTPKELKTKQLNVVFHRLMNGHPVKEEVDISLTDPDISHLTGKDNWKYSSQMLWHTACRRLSKKWPDWKRMMPLEEIATLEEAAVAIENLTGEKVDVSVNTKTGEVIQNDVIEAEFSESVEQAAVIPEKDQEIKEPKPCDMVCITCGKVCTAAEKEYSNKKYGHTLCLKCQKGQS